MLKVIKIIDTYTPLSMILWQKIASFVSVLMPVSVRRISNVVIDSPQPCHISLQLAVCDSFQQEPSSNLKKIDGFQMILGP
jgi:hypothetical protein